MCDFHLHSPIGMQLTQTDLASNRAVKVKREHMCVGPRI